MNRFYTLVNTFETPDGFEIHLDTKPVQTPARNILRAPNRALADAVMGEWAAQGDVIKPDTMPITQILATKIDRIIPKRADMHAHIMAYLDTDLVCYFTTQPPGMVAAQKSLWCPALDFFADKFGVSLDTTTQLKAITQNAAAHTGVDTYIKSLCDDRFTIVQLACALSGSLVLAIGFLSGKLTADHVLRAAHIEEDFKAVLYRSDEYGRDPLEEKKRVAMSADLDAAVFYLEML